MLPVASIRTDGGTQPRAHLNPDTVSDYANAMAEDATFPPVTVFYDGADYWLADGFHRVEASNRAGFTTIDADIRQGTRRDAVLFSVGANAVHGLRRTNEDKRRSVMTLLGDEEWAAWSDREIARRCAVDHKTVAALRPMPAAVTGEIPQLDRTYTTKHGTVATMRTDNIGKARQDVRPARPLPPAAPPVRSQIATTIPAGMPEDRVAMRHSAYVTDGLDRLLAAAEFWPDAADALPQLREYESIWGKLPIVADWLTRLLELWEEENPGEPRNGE